MKKSTYLACVLLCGLARFSAAQNLIPNPSFETFSSCPTNQGQVYLATPWFNPSTIGTPDYYNQCNSGPLNVPNSAGGYQSAFNGVAYTGMYLWSAVVAPNVREYIEAPLSAPLVSGQCYHFRMRINLSNNSSYTTRSIGAYLSDTIISKVNSLNPLPFLPQLVDTTGSRFDTSSWTLVSADYKAHGGERYIVIGNFKSDAATDTFAVAASPGGNGWIYCLVDSVSLTSANCNLELGIGQAAKDQVSVAPNPFVDQLRIGTTEAGAYELYIIGSDSRIVFRSTFSKVSEISTASFPPGVYFYEVKSRSGAVSRGKILKL